MKEAGVRPLSRRLGIVGGGQLARMLALEAPALGYQVHILCEKENEPAVSVCHHWLSGNPASHKDVLEFAPLVDDLTFESEFFPMDAYAEAHSHIGTFLFPNTNSMRTLQDRRLQKAWLDQFKIPTARWIIVQEQSDLEKAKSLFPKGFVLKKAKGGYDGNGTFYFRKSGDEVALKAQLPGDFIAEELIPFRRELAVLFARSKNGDLIQLPVVETSQKDSRCDWVSGPVASTSLKKISTSIQRGLKDLNYVGVIAFELFETGNVWLVNEVAPRVHNSGHYSQQGLRESQFHLHLRCGLGLDLNKPQLQAPAFCMVNLLGQSDQAPQAPLELSSTLHWYGKTENRKGRKMGHLNLIGNSRLALLKKALAERKKFRL